MVELKIDKEFKEKIPPLTEAEFEQLRENILSDGEVYEPIVTWNGVIVDGHNRWRIIQENPEIPFRTKEMDFTDKWAAFEWMYRKQLGRRNLTEQQKAYMIGKMYEARKKSVGAPEGNNNAEKQNGQNVQIVSRREIKDGTSGEIGKEFGIDGKTVRRNEHFAQGLDAIADVSKEAADKILKGESRVAKSDVSEMREATSEEVKEFADAVNRGELPKKRDGNWATREVRDRYGKIKEIAHQMGNEQRETSFDDVLRLLNSIEDDFLAKIERTIESEREKLSADERWPDSIEGYFDSVISDINDLKGRITK